MALGTGTKGILGFGYTTKATGFVSFAQIRYPEAYDWRMDKAVFSSKR